MCGVNDTDLCVAICRFFSGCVCHLEQLHAQSPFLFPIVFSINIYIANDESPSQHVTVGLAEARPNKQLQKKKKKKDHSHLMVSLASLVRTSCVSN